MADAIADLSAYVEKLKNDFPQLRDSLNQLLPSLERLTRSGGDGFKLLHEMADKFAENVKNKTPEAIKQFATTLTEEIKKSAEHLSSLSGGFSSLITALDDLSQMSKELWAQFQQGVNGATNETFELAGSFTLLTAAAAGLSTNEAFRKLGLDIDSANQKFKAIIDSGQRLIGLNLGDIAGTALKNILDASEASKQFENSVIQAAAKSGDLSNLLPAGQYGAEVAHTLDVVTDQIQQSARKSALAMGMSYQTSIKQTIDLLGALPGEVGKIYDNVTDISARPIQAMDLLQTVGKGTGQTFETVLGIAQSMFATFGSSAKDAAERVALLHQASSELRIPFDNLKNVVTSIDDSFKMWGNNAGSALAVLKQINEVLKEQGVGYSAQLEIVTNLFNAMKGLGLEKKAFIGMESGLGGTAVGAGLQVEQMIQQGDMGKVASMMQETLSKIGGAGRVLTLNEATQNPGQENAFLAQRMALGSIFGIQDTGMQNRLMDVMSKVSVGSELSADGSKALKDAFGRGESIQEKQLNKLENIYTELVTMKAIAASREAYEKSQQILGSASSPDMMNERLERERTASASTATNATAEGRAREVFDVEEAKKQGAAISDSVKDTFENASRDAKTVATQVSEAVANKQKEAERMQQQARDQEELRMAGFVSNTPMPSIQPQQLAQRSRTSRQDRSGNTQRMSPELEAGILGSIGLTPEQTPIMPPEMIGEGGRINTGGYLPYSVAVSNALTNMPMNEETARIAAEHGGVAGTQQGRLPPIDLNITVNHDNGDPRELVQIADALNRRETPSYTIGTRR